MWLGLLIYIRPNLIFMVPFTGVVFLLTEIWREGKINAEVLVKWTIFSSILASTFLLLLAPWTYAVSKKHDGFYLTTTSTELAVVITYAEGETRNSLLSKNASIPSPWYRLYDTYWEEAKSTGKGFSEISKGYTDKVVSETDWRKYATSVHASLISMYLEENQFLERFSNFLQNSKSSLAPTTTGITFNYLEKINTIIWYSVLLATLFILILPWRIAKETIGHSLLFRLAFVALAIQPFIVGTSGRYYIGMILLSAVGIGLTIGAIIENRSNQLRHESTHRLIALTEWSSWIFPIMVTTPLICVLVSS